MGLEVRNGRIYYYEKQRIAGRVVSQYIGAGEFALIAKRWAEDDRELNQIEAKRLKAARQRIENIDEDLSVLEKNINILLRAFLVSEGFYQTKSREWRYGKKEQTENR